jgi:hypothetical protein
MLLSHARPQETPSAGSEELEASLLTESGMFQMELQAAMQAVCEKHGKVNGWGLNSNIHISYYCPILAIFPLS